MNDIMLELNGTRLLVMLFSLTIILILYTGCRVNNENVTWLGHARQSAWDYSCMET